MSIRFRVAILALMAIVGVLTSLFLVFQDIRAEIFRLDTQAQKIAWAQESSQLIHMLQRERGSSGGYLVKPLAAYFERVKQNRANTDQSLSVLISSPRSNPDSIVTARLNTLGQDVAGLRVKIDNGVVNWVVARDFYTQAITSILDSISHQENSDNLAYSRELKAISELMAAREALGLIRATIYFISSQEKPNPHDFVDLAIFTGIYRQNIHNFVRDVDLQHKEWADELFRSRAYGRVLAVIEASMMSEFVLAPIDPSVWWERSTLLIDMLKTKEDFLYAQLRQSSDGRIAEINRLLQVFGVVSSIIGLLISVFAILTISKIMKELGSLITTFDTVVKTENFTIRVRSNGQDEFGRIGLLLNRLLDFTDSLIRDKERLAATDALTGIMNRRSFLKETTREIERTIRYGANLSLLFIDIDHFKRINDTYGHSVGDDVLRSFVNLLSRRIRTTDILARWGGEEFVVLMPESSAESAMQIADILRILVERETFPQVGRVTCSIGVASLRSKESFDEFCKRADGALYLAKSKGRNTACFAD
jgi:diguanylate cyclase (GGDEF)-like protein